MLLIQLPMWASFLLNFSIAIPLLAFLYKLLRYREDNYGRTMILILNISYALHPIMNIIARIFMILEYTRCVAVAVLLMTATESFSVTWSVFFAIFTYSVLRSKQLFHFRVFMIISLVVTFSMVALFLWLNSIQEFSTMDYEHSTNFQNLAYICIFEVFGTLLPVSIISYCYFKVYQFLKPQQLGDSIIYSRTSSTKLFMFFLVPIICLCPDVFAEITYMYRLHQSTILMLITDFLRRFWGLANLWTFWSTVSTDGGRSRNSSSASCELDSSTFNSYNKTAETESFLENQER